MTKYTVTQSDRYNFSGEKYGLASQLHGYPATMPPQIGLAILQELGISTGRMLDPYCGTGSSFVSGLHAGINEFYGCDVNPLATLITRVRLTPIPSEDLEDCLKKIKDRVWNADIGDSEAHSFMKNQDFWFHTNSARELWVIRKTILDHVENNDLRNF